MMVGPLKSGETQQPVQCTACVVTAGGSRKLFIRGLDYNTTIDELRGVFQEYGEIEDCVIPTDRQSGKSK